MLASSLVMKIKTPQKTQMAMITPNLTCTLKGTSKSQPKKPVLEGADMKPNVIKLWKHHNFVIASL